MEYFTLKYIHILSSTFLFGTGVGSAFYMFRANLSKDVPSIYFATRNVVIADWLFTTPTAIIQPVTGIMMMRLTGLSFSDPWIFWGIALYFLVGICWLPVVYFQIKMRDMARVAYETKTDLTKSYWRLERWWFWLGVIAFPAMVLIFHFMVFKP